ncbi:MAG: hypothetical protein K2J30_03810 [Clostridia bacterium]|nr:hypothetical protein [Clostridia bacterium]
MMIKRICRCVPIFFMLLCLALTLSACEVAEMSTLPELTKPYTGVYKCESLTLGGQDMTEKFPKLELELLYNGTFSLSYEDEEGGEGEYHGNYAVDAEAEEITFSAKAGLRNASFTFPMVKGRVFIDYRIGGKLLHAVFAMP